MRDHLDPAAAGEKPLGEPREHIGSLGRDAPEQIEVLLVQRHQRHPAVAGGRDDRTRVLV